MVVKLFREYIGPHELLKNGIPSSFDHLESLVGVCQCHKGRHVFVIVAKGSEVLHTVGLKVVGVDHYGQRSTE